MSDTPSTPESTAPNSDKYVLVLHGPNLNMLGTREPEIYGATTLPELEDSCRALGNEMGLRVECYQSNSEGDLVTRIQDARTHCTGIIINAGAYTHTSVAIHDALRALDAPIVELHISNVYARESFRHHSYISPIASAVMCGFGVAGYHYALLHLATLSQKSK